MRRIKQAGLKTFAIGVLAGFLFVTCFGAVVTYRSVEVQDPVPTGVGGLRYYNNWRSLADRSWVVTNAGDPDEDDDLSGTGGNGVCRVGTRWRNTTTNILWTCIDDTATAAVWAPCSGGVVGATTLGSELLQNRDFSSGDTNWTVGANWSTATGEAVHTTGAVAAISQDVAVTSGTVYVLEFSNSRTAGFLTVACSAANEEYHFQSTATCRCAFTATSTTTATFSFTPDTNFAGGLDDLTLKAVTATASADEAVLESDGSVVAEARGDASAKSSYFGFGSGQYASIGENCTAFGYGAMDANGAGASSSAFGVDALGASTSASFCTAMGYQALAANYNNGNSAFGFAALAQNTTAFQCTAVGRSSMYANTTGDRNTAIGALSLGGNTTGEGNTALGYKTLNAGTSPDYCVGVGWGSLLVSEGTGCIGIGYLAGSNADTANHLTAIGYFAGNDVVDGNYTTIVGAYSGEGLVNPVGCTLIGAGIGDTTALASNLSQYIIIGNGYDRMIEIDSSSDILWGDQEAQTWTWDTGTGDDPAMTVQDLRIDTANVRLTVSDQSLDTGAGVDWSGIKSTWDKDGGDQDGTEVFIGVDSIFTHTHDDDFFSLEGIKSTVTMSLGTAADDVAGATFATTVSGGTVTAQTHGIKNTCTMTGGTGTSDLYGIYSYLTAGSGVTSLGASVYGAYIAADIDEDPVGSAYLLYIHETTSTNLDYAFYSNSVAPSLFGGSVGTSTRTLSEIGAGVTTLATTSNVIQVSADDGGVTLATITGGVSGQLLTIIFSDDDVTITDNNDHDANSVDLSAAFTSADDTVLQLVYNGTSWYEVSRSAN